MRKKWHVREKQGKAACDLVESLYTEEKNKDQKVAMYRDTDCKEGSEYESAEEGHDGEENEKDDNEDAGAKDHNENLQASDGEGGGRATDDAMNVSGQSEGEDHRNGKGTVTNNNEQTDEGPCPSSSTVTPMRTVTGVESRRPAEVNNDFLEMNKKLHANIEDQQQQELHNSHSRECGEDNCLEEQPSNPSQHENPAFDANTPRRLRSYGRNRQGWLNIFVYIFMVNK